MFPLCVLVLFYLALFLLCFPLGKLPLSCLALEKCLYLREQDTGQNVYRMAEYSDLCTSLRKQAILPVIIFSNHILSKAARVTYKSKLWKI